MFTRALTPDLAGTCSPEFHPVRDTFYRLLKSGRDVGAGVSFTVAGETVVDLWGGHANVLRTREWQADTLTNIFSCTKGLAVLCVLRLVDAGLLELDAPLAQYWPAFAQRGKARITLRQVLGHRAGLPALYPLLSPAHPLEHFHIERHLERARPWWEPGTAHGYHALTIGWLLGRLVHSVTGRTLGRYFADEIARPLNLDVHIGTDPADHARISRPVFNLDLLEPHRDLLPFLRGIVADGTDAMALKALGNPVALGLHALTLSPTWSRIEQPAANGMATARDLARLYGILANGGKTADGFVLLSEQTLPLCWQEQSHGRDRVLKRVTRFSHGFMLGQPGDRLASYGPGTRSFGHNGLGGTLTVADPDRGVGFGYVTNRFSTYFLVDPRPRALLDAFYRCH